MIINILNFIKKYKKSFIAGLLVVLTVLYFVFGSSNGEVEAYTVKQVDVVQSVVLSGKVQTSDRADLGFAASGRISRILIKNNQQVGQGQILAQLEIGDLLADLKIKQANSSASQVDLESAEDEVEKVTEQEDTKVESARRTLLSEDLTVIPSSNDYEVDPPTVSGIYTGREGTYKISIRKENITSSDFELRTFDLEKTEVEIEDEGPTSLGTKGLYISFPADLSDYKDTTWYLGIPNKAGSSYTTNLNAYEEAKNERDLRIKEAEFAYKKILSSEGSIESSIAQAEIQKINAEIRKNTIYAPFKGIVTNIEKEVGESASVGERVISILGEEKLEVVLQVSELDVSRLLPGSLIKISLDAFPGEEFYGTLRTVNSRETEVEGVPVYEAFVELASDTRIKTGMSANGTVEIQSRKGVLAVPSYFVKKLGNQDMVDVIGDDGKIEARAVTLGLLGTDSMVEVVSGLSFGEQIRNAK